MEKQTPAHARASESSARKPGKKTVKRRHKGLIITLVSLLSVFGIAMVSLGVLVWQYGYNHDNSISGKSDSDMGITNGESFSKGVTNIALFGVDSRSKTNFKGNTDSIMIISIDQIHDKIKLISVMRDTLVYIPDHQFSKINAANSIGGPELAIKTLNLCFNLNIRNYAIVNFVGMVDIVEAVGGIEVDVTESEKNDANEHIGSMATELGTPRDYIKKAGLQTLSGVQAVCWARIRHVKTADGVRDDYGRTDRQRYVMEQLFNKALAAGKSQYPSMIKALLPYVQTSLSYNDIFSLAGVLTGDVSFEQTRVPMTEYIISGGYYEKTGNSTVYYNLTYAGKIINAFIYDDKKPEDYIAENGVDKTPWA